MRNLVLIFSMTILLLLGGYQAHAETSREIGLRAEWQYLDGNGIEVKYSDASYVQQEKNLNWIDFTIPNKPSYKSPEGEIWLRVKLPKGNFKDPSLYFMTYDQNIELYWQRHRVLSFGGFDKLSKLESPGSFWHIIDLNQGYEGSYMYFRLCSARAGNHGLLKECQLVSHSGKLISIIQDGALSFVHACLYVFIGFLAFLFYYIRKTNKRTFLYLSFSAIATGIWLLAEGTYKQFFLTDARLVVYIDILAQYSIPIFFALFINELLENRYRKLMLIMSSSHGFLLFGCLLADSLDLFPIVGTLNAFYVLFGINLLLLVYIILRSFKYCKTDVKIFIAGLSFLCLAVIADILNTTNRQHDNILYTRIGVFVLLTSFTMLLVYNIFKTQSSVSRYLDELNTKDEILTAKEKLLDEAMVNDKLKNEFFSNISHELKTPLNIILSTIQLLNKYTDEKLITSTEKDLYRYLYIMKQNSYRLIRLVNNLIDMTKIDAGYLGADLKNNDIVTVVEDITQSVADYIKRNGISITFDTNVEEKIIACDPDKIERIILNLLSNAVKFSKPGASILVEVQDKGEAVEIIVQDTGIGLNRDKLELIFERFAQVDKSLTRSHEGSGIGLSLVRSLVEMHGGNITVDSEYGKGSTFKIVIPANIAEFDEKAVDEIELQAVHVEKVNIEFSDIYS